MTGTLENSGGHVAPQKDADAAGTGANATVAAPRRSPARRKFGQRFAIIFIWIGMAGLFAAIEPELFLRPATLQAIFGLQQPLIFLALALVIVFAVGEFDISVPSILGLSATIVPVLAVDYDVNIGIAVAVAIGAAVLVGTLNGYLTVVIGVDPFAVTLGMSTLLIGVCLWMSGSTTVGGLDPALSAVSLTPVLGLPISFYYSIALALILAYVLARTPLGRHMTFVGANREVARLAGIPVRSIRWGAYIAASLIAGVGGVLLVLGIGGFDPSSSTTYLLPAFAAAILSTAVIVPGRFNPLGAVIAIFFLQTGVLGLQLLGLTGWITQVFYGAAVVIAVTISTLMRRRAA